ncbi:hypothetical protein GQ457_09G009120 [Hibiscus cannabinus]
MDGEEIESRRTTDCAICLEEFKDGSSCKVLPKCKHIYHRFCTYQWLVENRHCPFCRDSVNYTNPTPNTSFTLIDRNFQWLCYLSSTTVYGTHVFRFGGIYAPSRSVVEMTIKQEPLSEFQKRNVSKQFTFKVHVANNCQALKASIRTQLSKRIYSIIDDDTTSQRKVFVYALDLVGKKWHCLTKKITCHESVESFVQKASLRGEKQAGTTTLSFSNFRDIATSLAFSSSRARSNILSD